MTDRTGGAKLTHGLVAGIMLALFVVIGVSCSGLLGGTGVVRVRLVSSSPAVGGSNRTVVPDLVAGVTTYRITLTDTSGIHGPYTETVTAAQGAAGISFTLEIGTWDVLVEAVAGTQTPVKGSLNGQVVTAGGTATWAVTLTPEEPDGTGTGDMSLGVRFPDATGIDSLVWTLEYNAGGVVPGMGPTTIRSFGTDGANSTATISASGIPSGSYSLLLAFKRGTANAGMFRESVNIWNGLVSNKWVSPVDADNDGQQDLLDARTFGVAEFFETNATLASVSFLDGAGQALAGSFTSTMTTPLDMGLVARAPITFTPVGGVSGQSIAYRWNGGPAKAAYDGVSSSALNLLPGTNTLELTVTAPDQQHTHVYNFTFDWVQNYTGSSSVAVEMVQVSGGTMVLGLASYRYDASLNLRYRTPQHSVTVSDFLLGKYEVTQAQYQAVMGTNPSAFSDDSNKPVQNVTYLQAIEFCNKLSLLEGLEPVYTEITATTAPDLSKNGYRLPTDAEWEYAARGGQRVEATNGSYGTGHSFAGSNNPDEVAIYGVATGPAVVGSKAPNQLGIYDLSGNVMEYTADVINCYVASAPVSFQPFDPGPAVDPLVTKRTYSAHPLYELVATSGQAGQTGMAPFGAVTTPLFAGATAYVAAYRSAMGGAYNVGGTILEDISNCGRLAIGADASEATIGFRVARGVRPLVRLVTIPAGTEPTTGVPVGEFQMGATEVTQGQFKTVMGYVDELSDMWDDAPGDEIPARSVSFYDALMFCNKLSIREGLRPVYTLKNVVYAGTVGLSSITAATVSADFNRNGYRLPTLSERTWAVRGGQNTSYYWGDTLADYTGYEWTADNTAVYGYSAAFMPVAQKLPNPYGLYDILGNAYEWSWGTDHQYAFESKRCGGTSRNPGDATYMAATANWDCSAGNGPGYYDNGFRVVRGAIDPASQYYQITYHADGGTLSENSIASTPVGNSITLYTASVFARGTTELLGFRDNTGGTGTLHLPGDSIIPAGNLDLYAQWALVGAYGPAGGLIFYDAGSEQVDATYGNWRYMESGLVNLVGAGTDGTIGAAGAVMAYGPAGMHNGNDVTSTQSIVGSGPGNTAAIVAERLTDIGGNINYNTAAQICDNYSVLVGGTTYGDWFLPSAHELYQMYFKLHVNGKGGFASDNYWSSTDTADDDCASVVPFSTGEITATDTWHSQPYLVRPARRFLAPAP